MRVLSRGFGLFRSLRFVETFFSRTQCSCISVILCSRNFHSLRFGIDPKGLGVSLERLQRYPPIRHERGQDAGHHSPENARKPRVLGEQRTAQQRVYGQVGGRDGG